MKNKKVTMKHLVICILCLSLLVWSSCSKPTTEISCASTISFRTDLVPIFKNSCALVGCHTGGSPQGHLNLDSAVAYTNLSTKGYFTAGNPTLSIVYDRMTSTSNPMPASGVLPSAQTDKVYCWIKQGGLNN